MLLLPGEGVFVKFSADSKNRVSLDVIHHHMW